MPTNLYGPCDNFDLETSHALAALLRKAHEAKMSGAGEMIVWGTGEPRREFLHVDDLAAAVLFLLEKYDSTEIINVGCGEDISIRELAELICDVVGFRGELKWDRSKPNGTPRKLLDVSKIKKLGWQPTISLRVGVVGVGHIGSNHARIYAELPHAEFVAVFDIDPARAAEIATKYKAKAAESLNEFADMVDAASVATPTNAHFSVARDLLARGKHLLIEKPITEITADARELAQRAAEKRLVLQVGHVERFNPVLSALEQRLTHPRFIEAHRLSPY